MFHKSGMLLFKLPKYVALNVFHEWLRTRDIGLLDSATCNTLNRNHILTLYEQLSVYSVAEKSATRRHIIWLGLRKIKVLNLTLKTSFAGFPELNSFSCLLNLVSLSLDISDCLSKYEHHLTSLIKCCTKLQVLKMKSCTKKRYIELLAQNCLNLQTLELHNNLTSDVDNECLTNLAKSCFYLKSVSLNSYHLVTNGLSFLKYCPFLEHFEFGIHRLNTPQFHELLVPLSILNIKLVEFTDDTVKLVLQNESIIDNVKIGLKSIKIHYNHTEAAQKQLFADLSDKSLNLLELTSISAYGTCLDQEQFLIILSKFGKHLQKLVYHCDQPFDPFVSLICTQCTILAHLDIIYTEYKVDYFTNKIGHFGCTSDGLITCIKACKLLETLIIRFDYYSIVDYDKDKTKLLVVDAMWQDVLLNHAVRSVMDSRPTKATDNTPTNAPIAYKKFLTLSENDDDMLDFLDINDEQSILQQITDNNNNKYASFDPIVSHANKPMKRHSIIDQEDPFAAMIVHFMSLNPNLHLTIVPSATVHFRTCYCQFRSYKTCSIRKVDILSKICELVTLKSCNKVFTERKKNGTINFGVKL